MFVCFRYLVTALMGADMNNIIKTQRLSDDHVQFLIYQVLRAMKVSFCWLDYHVNIHLTTLLQVHLMG